MLSRELQSSGRARVHRRQNSSAPCPGGNGTIIGTSQEFTVLCNRNIDGDVLERLDAFDFTACVDICSSFHPKCEGVSFDGSRCTLRANFRPQDQRFSIRSESAIGAFPGASSNCATLGGGQQALGTSFTTMCGFIIGGNDISQNFAPTFQDCLGQCAATSGCAAVSFDPSQDLGFKNCYLKTTLANPSDLAADRRTDSAIVAAAAAVPDPSSVAEPAATPAPANPGVSTIPLASTPPAGNGGVIFFTPPGGSGSSTTPPTEPPTTLTTDLASTPSSSSSLPVNSFPFLFPSTSLSSSSSDTAPVPSSAEAAAAGDAPPSMAWVAAPVVGGVAAIALIAVSFVILRRRRRGPASSSGSGSSSWLGGRVAGWLPASWLTSRSGGQGEGGGSKRVMAGMGNFSEVESGRRSVEVRGGAGVRNSVVGFMTGRPMGMERLEDIEERAPPALTGEGGKRVTELRNSFNGLGQNKWSQ